MDCEIKQEFSNNEHSQCRTCLTVGRKLFSLGKHVELYRILTCNIKQLAKQPPEEIKICWECQALLDKAAQFAYRVEKAFEVLEMGQNYVCSSLSNLTTLVVKNTHLHFIDNQTNIQTATKSETTDVFDNNESFKQTMDEDLQTYIPEDNKEINLQKEFKVDVKETNTTEKSKPINRWARKRALQNKKPKFKIFTNADIKLLFRKIKIDTIELRNYLKSKEYSNYYKRRRFRCVTCLRGFKYECSLIKHNEDIHKKNINLHSCDICSWAFKDKRHLAMHISKHYYKYVCSVCDYCTYNASERNVHVKNHRKVFQCLKCELLFGNRRDFYKHFKDWHEKFICDYCGVSFKMRYCIKNHIRKRHSVFACLPCNKRFARYNGLWLHNKVHHNHSAAPAPGYCVECDRLYPDVYRYRWHLANSARHKPKKKARIPCPGCDKVFSKNIYMKDHYNLVHLKQYKYRCEECNKNFIRNADLVKHTRKVHEGILPPKNKICYLCGRGFTTNKILANHVRTHTGERPCACALCPARFAQRAALAGHVRRLH